MPPQDFESLKRGGTPAAVVANPQPPADEWEQYKRKPEPAAAATPAPVSGFDPTSVHDTLVREFGSLGKGIASIPGAIYHAAADPATEEEKARMGESGMRQMGPAGRIIERSAIEPIRNAVNWYTDAARGRIPDPVGQALSVAPEALGMSAAAPIAGKIGESIPGAATAAKERISPNTNFRPSMERVSGGPAATPLGRIAELPPAEAANFPIDLRPSIERIMPEESGLPVERRSADPELQGWYKGPERRVGPIAQENLGFDPRPPEDLGNKVRPDTEAKLGPIKRGGKALNQSAVLGRIQPAEAPLSLDARMAQVLDQLAREPQAAETGPSAIEQTHARLGKPTPGTRIPGPDEDMTGLLNRSLKRVQDQKAPKKPN